MKKNVLIIGAGGVGSVVAHKCAQNNHILGDICLASRTVAKCEQIIEAVHEKGNLKDKSKRLYAKELHAEKTENVVALIRETASEIVINVGPSFVGMPVLDACLEAGAAYIDTSVHEDPDVLNADYSWYGEFHWKRKPLFLEKEITAILSVGFDPGVVNAYCAHALKHEFDTVDVIDILDVNAGDHGKFFATNFDPEVNIREVFEDAGYWEGRKWKTCPPHSRSMTCEFPTVGKHKVYLMGHDEIHSLHVNLDVDTIRFWMGFSDHYINCFQVLEKIGLLSHKPITTAEGLEVIPLKVVKACLPDPGSLAHNYTGKTCIGNLIKGKKDGKAREIFIYNICDHQECYQEVGSQAISYTAGVPPVAAAILVANGIWDVKKMANVEELDPDPFLHLIDEMGLPTKINEETKNVDGKDLY
uniref:Carboxynorspermidine dehydrogenase n=1 Tax=Candidatus Kentrum sp. MB TaxID=2138164 RepID=A0A450XC21_9GAMM|nr:MAG: carboxynorspermidine dehydrogenase [Candidatus Kentron sp. MB]VFK29266.1 MAG: carboxynorspermidine dehydrogenase [Candidatus Kentron sp. MB]VFK74722.1 MAG: carboxynorspermidine dehydrogenase [Candidatus Kentron sp. MB]